MNCGNTNGQRAIVWVFKAQMVEHCRANAEAMGSNPVEGPKSFFFFELISQLLKYCDITAMITSSFNESVCRTGYRDKLVPFLNYGKSKQA